MSDREEAMLQWAGVYLGVPVVVPLQKGRHAFLFIPGGQLRPAEHSYLIDVLNSMAAGMVRYDEDELN